MNGAWLASASFYNQLSTFTVWGYSFLRQDKCSVADTSNPSPNACMLIEALWERAVADPEIVRQLAKSGAAAR